MYAYKATLAWIEPTTAHEAVPTYSIEFRKDKSHKWKADDDYHKKAKATINGIIQSLNSKYVSIFLNISFESSRINLNNVGLVPGSTYVFRVVPWLNKIRGTPSLPTSSIVAENPYGNICKTFILLVKDDIRCFCFPMFRQPSVNKQ